MPSSYSLLANSHILIVDDNPDELRLLVEALRGTGCRLSVAFDGVQGYDRAVARLPDLILLDVRMPRMGGFAVCRQLKANPQTAHVPVMFLSSAGDINERLMGLREGGVDYILKPFSPEEVIARVQIHLRLSVGGRYVAQPWPEDLVRPTTVSSDDVLVRIAKNHLLERLADPPGLRELASFLGINEKRLTRIFRRASGGTVFEFLREERMRAAQRLLTQTSLSVAVIAAEVGFSSPANFSTAFLEHVGMSPSGFRSQATSKADDDDQK